MSEVSVSWAPKASEAQRPSKPEFAKLKEALKRHLSNGEWRYQAFEYEDDLPDSIAEELKAQGWSWTSTTWFKQTGPVYKEQVYGYKFEANT